MAAASPQAPRALAGRYRLVRLLARGGMAEVWEGHDEVLDRPVALKMLLAHLAADATLRERFRLEAVTAARLVHPGIVAVFDAGIEVLEGEGLGPGQAWPRERFAAGTAWAEPESTAYIVMELVRGETLRDLIARAAPLPPEVAVAITAQVAEALAFAHSHGLVHRDVKPANVLLSDEGGGLVRVKVADFGIAKATAGAGNDLTEVGTVLGTPKYLSPEQVEGKEPDARADLYSLGVVLFEMLVGRPPFSGPTDMATALARAQQPAPLLATVQPAVPQELARLVDNLLATEPARRVPSAIALCAALASLGSASSASARLGGDTYVQLPPAPEPCEDPTAPSREELGRDPGRTAGLPSAEPSVAIGQRRARHRRDRAGVRGWRKSGRSVSIMVGSLTVAGCLALGLLYVGGPEERSPVRPSGPGTTAAPSPQGGPSSQIRILGVGELTQLGIKPNDNLSELPNVFDGNPSTEWRSDVYDGPRFGRSGGFGLVVRLAGLYVLHQLSVASPMQGWSAEVFVASSYAPRLTGWGRPTAQRSGIRGDASFSLGGRRGAWVLFWMIDPGPSRQAVVQELSVR